MEQMQDGRTWLVLTTAAILRNQEDRNFFFRREQEKDMGGWVRRIGNPSPQKTTTTKKQTHIYIYIYIYVLRGHKSPELCLPKGTSTPNSEERKMREGKCFDSLRLQEAKRKSHRQCLPVRRLDFECILYDEAHSLRNAATNAFKHIDRGIAAKRRVLLTGTPVHNSLEQLGNLLKLVLNGAGSKKVHEMIKELDGIIERQALQTLQVRAAPFMMRRLKKDVMSELPTKTAKLLRCDLTPRQRKLYEAEIARVKDGSSKLKKAQKRKQLKGLFCTLRRLCNHPLLGQARFSEDDYQQIAEGFRLVRKDWATSSSERQSKSVGPCKCLEGLKLCLRSSNQLETEGFPNGSFPTTSIIAPPQKNTEK